MRTILITTLLLGRVNHLIEVRFKAVRDWVFVEVIIRKYKAFSSVVLTVKTPPYIFSNIIYTFTHNAVVVDRLLAIHIIYYDIIRAFWLLSCPSRVLPKTKRHKPNPIISNKRTVRPVPRRWPLAVIILQAIVMLQLCLYTRKEFFSLRVSLTYQKHKSQITLSKVQVQRYPHIYMHRLPRRAVHLGKQAQAFIAYYQLSQLGVKPRTLLFGVVREIVFKPAHIIALQVLNTSRFLFSCFVYIYRSSLSNQQAMLVVIS